MRTKAGMLYVEPPGWNWSRNHRRCCAKDSGSGPVRGTGTSAGAVSGWEAPVASMRSARAATVGASKKARRGSSTPSWERMREMTCVASSECPPSSKKFPVTLTWGSRRMAAKMAASFSSVGVRGATKESADEAASGTGRAFLSTLPLGVSGSASSTTKAEGTMYSGSRCRRKVRRAAVSSEAGAVT